MKVIVTWMDDKYETYEVKDETCINTCGVDNITLKLTNGDKVYIFTRSIRTIITKPDSITGYVVTEDTNTLKDTETPIDRVFDYCSVTTSNKVPNTSDIPIHMNLK